MDLNDLSLREAAERWLRYICGAIRNYLRKRSIILDIDDLEERCHDAFLKCLRIENKKMEGTSAKSFFATTAIHHTIDCLRSPKQKIVTVSINPNGDDPPLELPYEPPQGQREARIELAYMFNKCRPLMTDAQKRFADSYMKNDYNVPKASGAIDIDRRTGHKHFQDIIKIVKKYFNIDDMPSTRPADKKDSNPYDKEDS